MKKILFILTMNLFAVQHIVGTMHSDQETRKLFVKLSFPTSSGQPIIDKRLLQESPEKTIREVRVEIARSLGIWPSLIKVRDRKGNLLPEQLKIGYEVGERPQDPLCMFIDVGVKQSARDKVRSYFVDSTFLQ